MAEVAKSIIRQEIKMKKMRVGDHVAIGIWGQAGNKISEWNPPIIAINFKMRLFRVAGRDNAFSIDGWSYSTVKSCWMSHDEAKKLYAERKKEEAEGWVFE